MIFSHGVYKIGPVIMVSCEGKGLLAVLLPADLHAVDGWLEGGPCASVVWSHGSCKHSSEVQTSEAKEEKG